MGKRRELHAVDWSARQATPQNHDSEACEIEFQPIAELGTGRVTAYEARPRSREQRLAPEKCSAAPKETGPGPESELAAIATSVEAVRGLPHNVALVIKCSRLIVASGAFADAIAGLPHEQIVVELTGDLGPGDRDVLFDQLGLLQFRGVTVAMKGPGEGRSGLRQILRIRPDLIKIDRQSISGAGSDCGRRLIVATHVGLARELGARVVGEGIETRRELATLRAMGVDLGQGSMIGRPLDYETALATLSFMRHAE